MSDAAPLASSASTSPSPAAAPGPGGQERTADVPPPFLGTWARVHTLVVVWLVICVAVFFAITELHR